MKYKFLGAALAFAGILMIATYRFHLAGLIMIIVGVYLAILKGVRPK
jgi:hypothetical protein